MPSNPLWAFKLGNKKDAGFCLLPIPSAWPSHCLLTSRISNVETHADKYCVAYVNFVMKQKLIGGNTYPWASNIALSLRGLFEFAKFGRPRIRR